MLEKKLAALEPFGQLYSNSLADDIRTGETDEGIGFSNIDIPKHRETRRHTAVDRVYKN